MDRVGDYGDEWHDTPSPGDERTRPTKNAPTRRSRALPAVKGVAGALRHTPPSAEEVRIANQRAWDAVRPAAVLDEHGEVPDEADVARGGRLPRDVENTARLSFDPDNPTERHCVNCHHTIVNTTGSYFGEACPVCRVPWGERPAVTVIGTVQPPSSCSVCVVYGLGGVPRV